MQISDTELKKVLQTGGHALIESEDGFEVSPKAEDGPMIKELVAAVRAMPDREDRIAELKARIESGEYKPSAEEIADAMIRRAIADRIG